MLVLLRIIDFASLVKERLIDLDVSKLSTKLMQRCCCDDGGSFCCCSGFWSQCMVGFHMPHKIGPSIIGIYLVAFTLE
jgi:hypothetical protein